MTRWWDEEIEERHDEDGDEGGMAAGLGPSEACDEDVSPMDMGDESSHAEYDEDLDEDSFYDELPFD